MNQKSNALSQILGLEANPVISPIVQLKKQFDYYSITLLKDLDEENIPKKLEFKTILALRKLINIDPTIVLHPQLDRFALGFLKINCMNIEVELNFNGPKFQDILNTLDPGFMENLRQVFEEIQNGISQNVPSPYELLNKVQTEEMMSVGIVEALRKILDFCLILPETYSSSSEDLLYAVMLFGAIYNNEISAHLGWFDGAVQGYVEDLKLLIHASCLEILNQEQNPNFNL